VSLFSNNVGLEMHSIYQRINVASALLSSCLFGLLAVIALTSYVHDVNPKGTLAIDSLKVKASKTRYSSRIQDTVHVTFDFDADLRPLFDWNTKQAFLYLSGEYTNKQGTLNEVVFWDRIVKRERDANLHIRSRNKYTFKDTSKTFSNSSSVTFSMKYNVMPWVGYLKYGVAAQTEPMEFPGSGSVV